MQDRKIRDQVTGVENAGPENEGSENAGLEDEELRRIWKMKDNDVSEKGL